MIYHGEFGEIAVDAPEIAIFADTQYEPPAVYEWLDFLESTVSGRIEIRRVTKGNIKADALRSQVRGKKTKDGGRWASMPYFVDVKNPKPIPGGLIAAILADPGRIRRQCTSEYKINPLSKEQRRLLGYKPRQRIPDDACEVWLGISVDEIYRMKPSRDNWIVRRWPLTEKRMTRQDCKIWMAEHGYPEPPRSACICCPYHNDHEWRKMRDEDPESWSDAVDFDKKIRHLGGMRGDCYLHRSLVPLDEVNLDTVEDRGQLNLFNNECEGMCGV